MEISTLIDIASKAYDRDDSELVRNYFDEPDGNHGDTLAKFIAIELQETFDPGLDDGAQLSQASQYMEKAADQLESLSTSLAAEALKHGWK
ncbi:MAG: hypothetical protein Q7K03_08450 [Dehalococcoidia bacterium]|nr:hypothetical protein [Dehalococcoidia bacterium]